MRPAHFRRVNPVRESRVAKVVQMFSDLAIGDIITREQMHREVADLLEADISKARRQAELENSTLYETVRGVGYMRVSGGKGAVEAGEAHLRSVRRTTRKVDQRLAKAFFAANDVTEDEVADFARQQMARSIMVHASYRKNVIAPPVLRPSLVSDITADMIKRMSGKPGVRKP